MSHPLFVVEGYSHVLCTQKTSSIAFSYFLYLYIQETCSTLFLTTYHNMHLFKVTSILVVGNKFDFFLQIKFRAIVYLFTKIREIKARDCSV